MRLGAGEDDGKELGAGEVGGERLGAAEGIVKRLITASIATAKHLTTTRKKRETEVIFPHCDRLE